MDNFMSTVQNTSLQVWLGIAAYLLIFAVISVIRGYILGKIAFKVVWIWAFFPVTVPYIIVETSFWRVFYNVRKARAKRLFQELGLAVPANTWETEVADNNLQYFARKYNDAIIGENNARELKNKKRLHSAEKLVKEAKAEFWKAHEAFRLYGFEVRSKFSDYLS